MEKRKSLTVGEQVFEGKVTAKEVEERIINATQAYVSKHKVALSISEATTEIHLLVGTRVFAEYNLKNKRVDPCSTKGKIYTEEIDVLIDITDIEDLEELEDLGTEFGTISRQFSVHGMLSVALEDNIRHFYNGALIQVRQPELAVLGVRE